VSHLGRQDGDPLVVDLRGQTIESWSSGTHPKCSRRFVTANLWHSCHVGSVDEFFRDHAHLRPLFNAYVRFVEAIGPFDVEVVQSRCCFGPKKNSWAGGRRPTASDSRCGDRAPSAPANAAAYVPAPCSVSHCLARAATSSRVPPWARIMRATAVGTAPSLSEAFMQSAP